MRSLARFDEMRLSGVLPVSGAFVFVAHGWVDPGRDPRISLSLTAVFVLAGLLITHRPLLARLLATGSAVAFGVLTMEQLLLSPAVALATWLGILWMLSALWVLPGLPRDRRFAPESIEPLARLARVRISLRLTAVFAVLVALSRAHAPMGARLAVIGSLLLSLAWMSRARPQGPWSRHPAVFLLPLPMILVLVLWRVEHGGEVALVILALFALLVATALRHGHTVESSSMAWWEPLLENPARQLVASFLLMITVGTLLLRLPLACTHPEPAHFVDAAFTAVSAVCVTGLVTLDTAVDWSTVGQGIILVLIQLGGLGIMSFATVLFSALGRRLTVRQEGAIAELTSQENRLELYRAVKVILAITFLAEATGALMLAARFHHAYADPLGMALWRGVFTSVSAFCNAGFALQTDSLIGYARDPWVLNVLGLLIVLGGLSPGVVVTVLHRRWSRSLQARLVLLTSALLLALGGILFLTFEWSNTLAGMTGWEKLQNAWFQSITLRTAGFNTIDFQAIRPVTVTLCLLWMFIGGSPGSTAGGIKTTTFAVLVLAVVATIRGQRVVTAFGRSIPHTTVYRATSVATIGTLSLLLTLGAIQLTQSAPVVPALFEVASALGTVGLSMGATAMLDPVGKILIMLTMFVGRVGSLTLLVFLMAQQSKDPRRWPEESIDVG